MPERTQRPGARPDQGARQAQRQPDRPAAPAGPVLYLSPGGMPGLQAGAGNRALAAVLAGGGGVQRQDPPDPAKERVRTLRSAITDRSVPSGVKTTTWPSGLYEWLNKQSGRHAELEGGYKSEYKTDANEDLVANLGVDIGVRSSAYLRFGSLRLADKLPFALYGTDFDLETMRTASRRSSPASSTPRPCSGSAPATSCARSWPSASSARSTSSRPSSRRPG